MTEFGNIMYMGQKGNGYPRKKKNFLSILMFKIGSISKLNETKLRVHDSIRPCILICITICTAIKIIKRYSDGSWVYINIYWNSNDSEDKGWKSFKEFMDIRAALRRPQAF